MLDPRRIFHKNIYPLSIKIGSFFNASSEGIYYDAVASCDEDGQPDCDDIGWDNLAQYIMNNLQPIGVMFLKFKKMVLTIQLKGSY